MFLQDKRFFTKRLSRFTQQADLDRHEKRFFLLLSRGRRTGLGNAYGITLSGLVILCCYPQHRRTGLGIPAFEPAKVKAGGILHGLDKVITGHGLAVMAGEIEIHTFAEPQWPEQGMDHADHFGSLVVHGQGVEIIYLDKGIRPDRMGHGPAILTKLERADHIDIVNAFDRP